MRPDTLASGISTECAVREFRFSNNDANHPGLYGFDEWLSVTNYFDIDPLMSRKGEFEQFQGDSSKVIVGEALRFMARQTSNGFSLSGRHLVWITPQSTAGRGGGSTGIR